MYSFNIEIGNRNDILENIKIEFDLLKTIYSDDLKLYSEALPLNFKINLNYEYEDSGNLAEIIKDLKYDVFLIKGDKIHLPYSIAFNINSDSVDITLNCFWMKKQIKEFDKFKQNISINEESGLFNIIENFKDFVVTPDKNVLINWLQKMKEENIIKCNNPFDDESKYSIM